MQTSHTRLLLALAALIALCAVSFAQPTTSEVQVSDQKSGSMLIFPFYGSDGAGGDTRLTITNVGPVATGTVPMVGGFGTAQTISNNLNVHLFFLDSTCAQADVYLCFTKYQSYSFKASEWDPVTKRGELIAVAVDNMGYPIAYDGLIGNAFVNTTVGTDKWVGNYAPEAFSALGQLDANGFYQEDALSAATGSSTAQLWMDQGRHNGVNGYDAAPNSFAVEFQSPVDSKNQAILTMGISGTIGGALSGNAAFGIGAIYRNDEKLYSFTPPTGGCSVVTLISDASIRIVGGLSTSIGSGKTGTAIWAVGAPRQSGAAIGLFITPVQANGTYSGIRTLHKRTTGAGRLIMPVFMPICL